MHGLQLCAVTPFPIIFLWLLALSGGLLLSSCLLCAVVEKYSSKMCSNILATKSRGLQFCAVAAFPLILLWHLALSGGMLLSSCLLCTVVEKYSSKMHSKSLSNQVLWLTALCSGCLPSDPPLAPGTLRWVAAAVLLAVRCGREIFFKNAQQSLCCLVTWLTALCSGCLPPDPPLAPGTLNRTKRAATTDQLTLCCETELFQNAQQYLSN